jgi:hypothetical protein
MIHGANEPIGMLRALARRAANGEDVTGEEISRALDGLADAPTHSSFEPLLDRLAQDVDRGGPHAQKRVFHAARGLAEWLAIGGGELPAPLPLKRCGVERRRTDAPRERLRESLVPAERGARR